MALNCGIGNDTADRQSAEHSDLDAARDRLHDFVNQRVRELQLLTRWPLLSFPKSKEQLQELQEDLGAEVRSLRVRLILTILAAEGCNPWEILGEEGSAVLSLPELPAMVRKDLLGPMELLLALAGQMGKVGR